MKKRLIGFMPIFLLFTLFSGIFCKAIDVGDKSYVNTTRECANGGYLYERFTGETIALRMMYLANSNTSNAAPIQGNDGAPIWAYCIDFGNSVYSQNIRTGGQPNNSAYWNSLSADAIKGISLSALYGCPNNAFGVLEDDAYAATQILIWEFQTGIRPSSERDIKVDVNYRGKVFSKNRFSSVLKGKKGEIAYNALVNCVYTHDVSPNFDNTDMGFNKTEKKYIGVFNDTNKVLEQYNVNCSNPAIVIEKAGNTLKLSSNTYVSDFTLTFNRKPIATGNSMLVLKAENAGQECIIGCNTFPASKSINVHINPLVIPMHKIGVYKTGEVFKEWKVNQNVYEAQYENSYLANCKVEIYALNDIYTEDGIKRFSKDELVDTLVTSNKDIVYSRELYEGQYYLVEVSAPDGFVKTEEQKVINLESADEYYINTCIFNERLRPNFSFLKSMENASISDCIKLFENVTFGVFLKDEYKGAAADSLLEIIHPLGDGTIRTTTDLPIDGSYYIRELRTAQGYILDENKYYFDFNMGSDNYSLEDNIVSFTMKNITNKEVPPTVEITEHTPLTPTIPKVTETPLTADRNITPIVVLFFASSLGLGIIIPSKKYE